MTWEQDLHEQALAAASKDDRETLIAYLLVCVRNNDWHAVSDAANDLRVLEARTGKR